MVVFILILVTKNKSMTDEKKSIDKRKDNATYEIRKRREKKSRYAWNASSHCDATLSVQIVELPT